MMSQSLEKAITGAGWNIVEGCGSRYILENPRLSNYISLSSDRDDDIVWEVSRLARDYDPEAEAKACIEDGCICLEYPQVLEEEETNKRAFQNLAITLLGWYRTALEEELAKVRKEIGNAA